MSVSQRPFGVLLAIAALAVLNGTVADDANAQQQATRSQAEHKPVGPALRSSVFPADTGRVRTTESAVFRSLVDTLTSNLSRLEIHVTTLGPGKSPHPPHRHAHEELMIVRSGTLNVLQNDVTRRAGPGAVIFQASNELHGLENPGPDSATYVVIRIDPHDLATHGHPKPGVPTRPKP